MIDLILAIMIVITGFIVFWAVVCVMFKIMFKIADAIFFPGKAAE